MIKVYTAPSLPDAHILLQVLLDAGIEARVFNENAQGAMGELPFTHAYPQLWALNDADYERARQLIMAFERKPVNTSTIFCATCNEQNPGNFQLCWHCAAAL